MKKILHSLILVLISCSYGIAQTETVSEIQTNRFGAMANIDIGMNFSDGVFKESSERRVSVGAAYTNKQRKFIGFLGFGARLFKFTLRTPRPSSSFIDELNANYTPIEQVGLDSLVGVEMTKGGSFRGTSGAWIYAGFTWNNPFRPSLEFYFGGKGINSYGQGYAQYTDPTYMDVEYASLILKYYELKFGFSPLFLTKNDWPFNLSINLGYRLSDYGDFLIDDIPMSSYTNSNFTRKHRFTNCFTLSLAAQFWSNW